MDLASTPFHSLAMDNFKEIILYSCGRTLHAMNCVCKSLSVLTLPLINRYAPYNYLTVLVDTAKKDDAENLKKLIKEFYWGYENILDWMPRIIPSVKLSDDSSLEMHLAKGDRGWAKKQSAGDQETIAECRNRYLSCLDEFTETIKSFYKNSNCIVRYYTKREGMPSHYPDQLQYALYKSIEENNIFIVKLLLVQNYDIANRPITTKFKSYAIHFAVENNKIDIIRLLLPICNINMQNYIGNTPLMLAVCNRYIDLIKLLLQYKPNIMITNQYRSNAIEYSPTESIKNMLLTLQESKSSKNQ